MICFPVKNSTGFQHLPAFFLSQRNFLEVLGAGAEEGVHRLALAELLVGHDGVQKPLYLHLGLVHGRLVGQFSKQRFPKRRKLQLLRPGKISLEALLKVVEFRE